jgi:monoamine oxidase
MSTQYEAAQHHSATGNHVDVAVVGGGMAGLYATWRLLQNQRDVKLFEATNRIGGRLRSVTIPGVAIRAELGAMRYTSRHRLLINLTNELGIRRGATKRFDIPGPSYYLRGHRLSPSALTWSTCPYQLRSDEKGKIPSQLVEHAIWKAIDQLTFPDNSANYADLRRRIKARTLSKSDLDLITRYGISNSQNLYNIAEDSPQHAIYNVNVPFRETGFWNLLQHYLSNEAFLLIHDGIGYESIVDNWNAEEAVSWFLADFSSNQQWLMQAGGLQTVADRLREEIQKKAHDNVIFTRFKLRSVTQVQFGTKPRYELEFADMRTKDRYTIFANTIILALPPRSLKEIVTNVEVWPMLPLDAVRPQRLFKLFLVYGYPWWRTHQLPGGETGRICTDLPIRQAYYFGPDWIRTHALAGAVDQAAADYREQHRDIADNISLVMASYSDARYVTFWDPMLRAKHSPELVYRGALAYDDFYTDKARSNLNSLIGVEGYGAPTRLVLKVQQQLAELHGIEFSDIPHPLVAIYMDWNGERDGAGDGWHVWYPHKDARDVVGQFMEIGRSHGIFVCGEAYSREQGWIEGALQSAQQVLDELA